MCVERRRDGVRSVWFWLPRENTLQGTEAGSWDPGQRLPQKQKPALMVAGTGEVAVEVGRSSDPSR